MGRFMTPDRMSGNASDPGSWNKYAYVEGDPVNRLDSTGQEISWDGGSYDVGMADGVYCGVYCQGQNTWANLALYAGVVAQGAVCQALISSYAGDGGAWNSGCGGLPAAVPVAAETCQSAFGSPSSAAEPQLAVLLGENSWWLGYSASTVQNEDLYMEQAMYNYATGRGYYPGTPSGIDASINTDTYRGYPAGVTTYNNALASPSLGAIPART